MYLCTWDSGIQMRFDHLHEDSKGVITGEIWVEDTQAQPAFLHHTRTTITSGDMGPKIGKACAGRSYRTETNWPDLVESARVNVMRRFRRGEPFLDLLEVPMNEGSSFWVNPLCYALQANLLFGPGGVGKSILAMYVAIMSAAGVAESSGFNVEPGNVCLLDYETSPDEATFRFGAMCEGLGIEDKPNFYYRRCVMPVAQDIARIQEYCQERNITFLIVDSAAPAVGGDTMDTGLTVGYFNALRSLNVTTLTLAHVRKEAPRDASPYGNVFWLNLPRTVWRVDAEDNEDRPDAKHVGLFHVKVNNGPKLKARGVEIKFGKNEDQVDIITIEPKALTNTILADNLPYQTNIKNMLLAYGALTALEIKELLPVGTVWNNAKQWLSTEAKANGKLVVDPVTKKYAMKAVAAEPPPEYQTSWEAPDD